MSNQENVDSVYEVQEEDRNDRSKRSCDEKRKTRDNWTVCYMWYKEVRVCEEIDSNVQKMMFFCRQAQEDLMFNLETSSISFEDNLFICLDHKHKIVVDCVRRINVSLNINTKKCIEVTNGSVSVRKVATD